ncbi:SusC/RagA family TonB-linked outer membrane protein [Puia dinghuensis]|uniref:SusC/RagA family TonB-linked outer membrane protein n=1 Tax=Puia dinghuensis TaxID=1792502 RepID=A0A8J2XT63_9BACT|nr:SusC/RagA family TonB-linked outer membrane protein [Puia dinghuensis]GGB14892.1 SusC/RagA family TonB-linked outer membrane protein [Puia dinghuensis]
MTIQRLLAKSVSLLLLCVLFTQSAFSQTKTITGKISDDKGAPIQGATVTAKGTKLGASTGADGTFSLSVPSTVTTLVISSVGFSTQEVSIASQTSINISLAAAQNNLNEVVVVGYNTVKRKDLTGSVTTVSAKEFNTGVITSPDQLLQNKVAGLEIINNSGQPGSATTVKIRGNTSIRGLSNPIYVIDGVILDGRNARPSVNLNIGGFGTTPDANPLLFINPYDIQDVTILKDASSTAIYGSRGANGVIVITTKKASAGPAKLEAGVSEGWNIGYMQKFDILNTSEFRSALTKYSINNQDKGSNVDPLHDITQHSTIQNYYLAMSSGNDVGKFRASALASKTPGFVKTNNLNKYIGNLGGSYKFLDKRVTLDFDVIAGRTEENIVNISNTAGSQGNLISAALQWNPTAPYYAANGMFNVLGNGVGNPMSLIAAYNDIAYVNTVLANMSVTVNIIKGLDYKFLYSINQSDGTRNTNIDGFLRGFNPIDGNGLGIHSEANLTSQIMTHTLNYHVNLTPDLTLNALAGFEYWKSNFGNSSYSGQGFNFNLNELQLTDAQYTDILGNAKTVGQPSVFRDITTEVQSLFARAELNYKDKYYLTGTIRDDGSSKFGSNNKHGYFPSFGAKWNIANEDFMKNGTAFSQLGLRATWGITGSQDFPAGSAINQFEVLGYNSVAQVNAGNPNLKWEQTTQFDFGLDFGLMNNRIYGSIDYYNKNTTNILFQNVAIQPGPAATYWINLPGHLKNNGGELTIGAAIVKTNDLDWNLTYNMAYNSNKITDFPTGLSIYTGQINGQGVSGTLGQIITNNQPVDEFYLKQFTGFDQKGNQTYANNPSFQGDPNPKWLFGGSTTVRYKKATLTLSGGGSGGFLILNNTAISVTNLAGIANGRNVDKLAYNSAEQPGSPVAANSRFLEKGNFFKLRSANLSYAIGNIGQYIKNASVFVAGSNLFVITKFSGFDPEVNIDKQNNGYPSQSIEYIPYPTPRSIVVGLNFTL